MLNLIKSNLKQPIALFMALLILFTTFAFSPIVVKAEASLGYYETTYWGGTIIRESPYVGSKMVGSLMPGDTRKVIEIVENGKWGKIDGNGGYICLDYARLKPLESSQPNISNNEKVLGLYTTTHSGGTIIREKPSTNSAMTGSAMPGQNFNVVEIVNQIWGRIQNKGYVHLGYMRLVSTENQNPPPVYKPSNTQELEKSYTLINEQEVIKRANILHTTIKKQGGINTFNKNYVGTIGASYKAYIACIKYVKNEKLVIDISNLSIQATLLFKDLNNAVKSVYDFNSLAFDSLKGLVDTELNKNSSNVISNDSVVMTLVEDAYSCSTKM